MARGATLYLRGLPEAVVREAKAAAARRGITLAALVGEALQRLVALPADAGVAPEGAQRTPEPPAARGGASAAALAGLSESVRWFEENRRRLLRRYRNQYVAIEGGRVIDHDRDFDALARRVFARVGVRPVFIPKVTAEERVVSLPSPRRGST